VLLGGVFSAQFGMAVVFATEAGLSVGQISAFVSTIFAAALVAQYPIGWLSDRMDRRVLILIIAAVGGGGALLGFVFPGNFAVILLAGAMMGGASNPLYSLLLAYANDYLEAEDMAAASAGFVFINGLGAVAGPIAVGWIMGLIGPAGFWLFVALLLGGLAAYAGYRMTQRAYTTSVEDQVPYAPVLASSSPLAVELAQEVYIEAEAEQQEDGAADTVGSPHAD